MNTKFTIPKSAEPLHVLLIGNNPIEMSGVLTKLKQIRTKKIVTEIAFDVKSILDRLIRFKPNFILIDDNIGKAELSQTIQALSQSNKTKDVPITVLKNSNYQESFGASGILDYLLKNNLSAEVLHSALRNSLHVRRAQQYLIQAYQKRKKSLLAFS
ncbi:hypothetical protein [Chryseosolibacter indicus]|uniref:Response regulatory domain-containing protein n=1 Tax=Chryseosolibacter indicus TaxID=2782351 RepID=A0ABS5VS01_9BACT|nr:hypothetical protein [Chryseosolibacter indicus]MBT1704217.1 hypothetical protein [Chryseosolibacter indicus]